MNDLHQQIIDKKRQRAMDLQSETRLQQLLTERLQREDEKKMEKLKELEKTTKEQYTDVNYSVMVEKMKLKQDEKRQRSVEKFSYFPFEEGEKYLKERNLKEKEIQQEYDSVKERTGRITIRGSKHRVLTT